MTAADASRVNVVMLGAPGAGKGTQASRLASAMGLPHVSTGDMLRDGIRSGLAVALVAKARIDRGELVDDDTMIAIVRERLTRADAGRGVVLDGFPRTVSQAAALDRLTATTDVGPLVVVELAVPESVLVARLASRRVCEGCGRNHEPRTSADVTCHHCGGGLVQRADDREDVVRDRLAVYARSTRPLLDFYRGRRGFGMVNGHQDMATVSRELQTIVRTLAGSVALVGAGR
jgi:adenylate kinase